MESLVEWLPRVGACITLIFGLVGFFKLKNRLKTYFLESRKK